MVLDARVLTIMELLTIYLYVVLARLSTSRSFSQDPTKKSKCQQKEQVIENAFFTNSISNIKLHKQHKKAEREFSCTHR